MSDSLTETVARAIYEGGIATTSWQLDASEWERNICRSQAAAVLAALDLPARERALRERIAQEVWGEADRRKAERALITGREDWADDPITLGHRLAAEFIRGGDHDV